MSFTEKYHSNKHRFGNFVSDPKRTNTHSRVKNQMGQILNLKSSQLLNLHQHRATHFYTSSTNLSNALNGGETTILVQPDSFNGWFEEMYLTIVLNNDTGGDIDLLPVPFWFRRIEFRIGNNLLQEEYSEQLHNEIALYENNVWKNRGFLANYDRNGNYLPSRELIRNGDTRRFYLKIGKFLTQTNFYLPAITGELRIRFFWRTFADYSLSGGQPSLDEVGVEIQSSEQLASVRDMTLKMHRSMNHHYRYLFNVRDVIPKTVSAGSEVPIELNSFSGSFTEFSVYVRPQNASDLGLMDYETFAIDRIQLENSDGQRVLGSTPIHFEENILYYNDVGYCNDMIQQSAHYRINLNKSIIDDKVASITGFFPVDTRSRLRLFFGNNSRAKIITITAAGAATLGNYRLVYASERYGVYKTDWLAFNSAVGAIEAGLNGLLIAQRTNTTFTVNQALSVGAAVIITFSTNGNNLGRLDPEGEIYVEGDASFDANFDSSITTSYFEGLNNTAVDIIVIGKQMALIELDTEGNISKLTS